MKHVRQVILATTAAALFLAGAPALQAQDAAQDETLQIAAEKKSVAPAKKTQPNRLAEFRITARDGEITPGTLQLRKGDRVKLTFVSKDSTYGVKIKTFGISEKVKPGEPVTVEFVASEVGEFDLRCSKYWGFKHWSTNGKIVVR